MSRPDASSRGILYPAAGDRHFSLTQRPPATDLAPFVDGFWLVRWDLRGRPPYAQETLPKPCCHLVIGTHRPGVHGVGTARFVAHLDGEGWVVGCRFRPGGFRPFSPVPVADLTDRAVGVAELFGPAGAALDRDVHGAAGDDDRIARVEAFLRARLPPPGAADEVERVARVVELARAEPAIARVDALAARAGVPVRTLQRLFRDHVGVGPKWIVRRYRIHEAAERASAGAAPDWSRLAAELGYADQAHFIRDFKAQVGATPAEYAARCAAG